MNRPFSFIPIIVFLLIFSAPGLSSFGQNPSGSSGQGARPGPDSSRTRFLSARAEIVDMLEGRQPFSFKRAVFLAENAYSDGKLDYRQYLLGISEAAHAVGLIQNHLRLEYSGRDRPNVLKNAALFNWFSDTTWFNFLGSRQVNYPLRYNFEDYLGENDWTSTFVSTLLRENKGNCQSLPFLYRIIAEEIGTRVHLAQAPGHFYIKFRTEKTGWFNTDLSSRQFPTDAWIMTSSYIPLIAIQKGLWMDTLSRREELALCLLELAKGYELRFGFEDPGLLDFVNAALQYFPGNANARIFKAEILRNRLQREPDSSGQLLQELQACYLSLLQDGYKAPPDQVLSNWLEGLNAPGKFPVADSVSGSPESGPFTFASDNPAILTLSKGKYPEQFRKEAISRIGGAQVETQTGRLLGHVSADILKTDFRLKPWNAARFLSVDPLTSSFPELTPYQYASNTPIMATDLDGLEANVAVYHSQNGGDPVLKANVPLQEMTGQSGKMGEGNLNLFYDFGETHTTLFAKYEVEGQKTQRFYYKVANKDAELITNLDFTDNSNLHHDLLSGLGTIPVLGEPFDGIDAISYALEGDEWNAWMSGGSMLPVWGSALFFARKAEKFLDAGRGVGKFLDAKELAKKLGTTVDDYHKNIKPLMKKDFSKEMKKLGTSNPDFSPDELGNVMLKNPQTGKTMTTKVPFDAYIK